MSVNRQGFERSFAGKNKKSNYVPMETGKSNTRKFTKREEAKAREKSKRSSSEQLDRLDSLGYNAKRERGKLKAKLKEQLKNQ